MANKVYFTVTFGASMPDFETEEELEKYVLEPADAIDKINHVLADLNQNKDILVKVDPEYFSDKEEQLEKELHRWEVKQLQRVRGLFRHAEICTDDMVVEKLSLIEEGGVENE